MITNHMKLALHTITNHASL